MWRIVIPRGGTNQITNPSFEHSHFDPTWGTVANSWSATGGGTISPVANTSRYGAWACSVGGDYTGHTGHGIQYSPLTMTSGWPTSSIPYVATLWARGDGATAARPATVSIHSPSTGFTVSVTQVLPADGSWVRFDVQGVILSTVNDAQINLTTTAFNAAGGAIGVTNLVYIDGVMFVQTNIGNGNSIPPQVGLDYIDGDQPGCSWQGAPHNSISYRATNYRLAGYEYDLDTLFYVSAVSGLGPPEIKPIILERATLPTQYLGTKTTERKIQLSLTAISSDDSEVQAARNQLFKLVCPDALYPVQPFMLRYYSDTGTVPLELPCIYDGGLDNVNYRRGNTSALVLRLLAYDDVYWKELGDQAVRLSFYQTAQITGLGSRIGGFWSWFGGPAFNGGTQINAIIQGADGNLYIGGKWTDVNSIGYTANIVMWDGTQFSSLVDAGHGGPCSLNGQVWTIVNGPDGKLYIGGDFTGINTTAGGGPLPAVAFAVYDPIANAWGTMSNPGVSATAGVDTAGPSVYAISFDQAENLYVGGDFNAIGSGGVWGGASGTSYISYYNGTWHQMGTSGTAGTDDIVRTICTGVDGAVNVGGDFLHAGGDGSSRYSIPYMARWDGSWHSVTGGQPDNSVYSIITDAYGVLYVGGVFANVGGVAANGVASWQNYWFPLGVGFTSAGVLSLVLAPDQVIYAAAANALSGSGAQQIKGSFWAYNGSAWHTVDVTNGPVPIVTLNYVSAVYVDSLGSVYIGTRTPSHATDSFGHISTGLPTQVINTCTASTFPKFTVYTSAAGETLRWIANETTNQRLVFNYPLHKNETVTIDLNPLGKSITSNLGGNLLSKLAVGSDFSAFCLIPGINNITAFVDGTGSSDTEVKMTYRNTHWTLDGPAVL